jgi:hypothetical protein
MEDVRSLRGEEDEGLKRGEEKGFWSEDEAWEKTEEERIVSSWEDEEAEFTKSFFGGAAGTPVRVLPVGDHGAREGYPAYAPELREESPGGKESFGMCESENAESENATEKENAESENADAVRLATYENLVLRASRIAQQRSAPPSRPPSPLSPRRCDEATQKEDVEANSAPGGETPGPRCNLDERLSKLELVMMKVRDSQVQETQCRKQARRAWKRREKQRQKRVALAEESPGNGPVQGPADRLGNSEARVSSEIPTTDCPPP